MEALTSPTHDPEAPFGLRTPDRRAVVEYAIEALYYAQLPLIRYAQSEQEKAVLSNPEGLRKRYGLARMGLLALLENIRLVEEWS